MKNKILFTNLFLIIGLSISSFANEPTQEMHDALLEENAALAEELLSPAAAVEVAAVAGSAPLGRIPVSITNSGTKCVAVSSLADVGDVTVFGYTVVGQKMRLATKTKQWLGALLASRSNPELIVYIEPGATEIFYADPELSLAFYQFDKLRGAANIVALGQACVGVVSCLASPAASWMARLRGVFSASCGSKLINPGCRISQAEFTTLAAAQSPINLVIADSTEDKESLTWVLG